jgi:RNA-directed DNA polymerase
MKARISITSEDEKLANKQLKNQWNSIDWKTAEKHVNRLQVRITKAVKECKWYLVPDLDII